MATFTYYAYPQWLNRFPILIQLVFLFNWLHQLRKWYCYPQLNKIIKQLPKGAVVVDYGCGEGQYLLPFAKRFPHIRFIAIDKNEQTIEFIRTYCIKRKIHNMECLHMNLAEVPDFGMQADLAICIGVLQYFSSPAGIVEQMLKANQLFLYQPVGYKMVTKWYRKIKQRHTDYDTVENIQHHFTIESLLGLFENNKPKVVLKEFTYGKFGSLSREIADGIIILFANTSVVFRVMYMLLFVCVLPICWVFMLIDLLSRKKDGNGVMMVLSGK